MLQPGAGARNDGGCPLNGYDLGEAVPEGMKSGGAPGIDPRLEPPALRALVDAGHFHNKGRGGCTLPHQERRQRSLEDIERAPETREKDQG